METFGMDDDFKMEEEFYILVSNTDLDEDEKSVMLAKSNYYYYWRKN